MLINRSAILFLTERGTTRLNTFKLINKLNNDYLFRFKAVLSRSKSTKNDANDDKIKDETKSKDKLITAKEKLLIATAPVLKG